MNEKIRTLVNEILLDSDVRFNQMERRGIQSLVEEKFAQNPSLTDEELTTIVKNTIGQSTQNKQPEMAKNHFGAPISLEAMQSRIKELTAQLSSPHESERVSADRELAGLLKNNQDKLM